MTRLHRYIQSAPLRSKLFFGTAAAVLLVVTAGNLILFLIFRGNIQKDIQTRLSEGNAAITNLIRTSVSAAIRNHLKAVAEKNKEIASYFHSLAEQGRMSQDEAKARAEEVLLSQTIGTTGYIFCVDSGHVMRVHPVEGMRGADVSRFPLSRRQAEIKEGYLEYEWANPGEDSPRRKAMYMTYFEPWDWIISASSYREEFISLAPLDDIRKGVLAHTFGDSGYSYILNYDGVVVFHPKLEGITPAKAKSHIDAKFFQEAKRLRNGVIYYPFRLPGEERYRDKVAIFNDIPELGWIVFSSGYLEEFRRPLRVLLYGMAGSTLGVIVILFILTWWIGGVMTRPLPAFIKALANGARGDLSQRMDETPGNEFGRLAKYYNHFMDSLETSQRQLADSEEKFRVIFEQAVEAMFRAQHEKGLIAVNPAMAKIFGYSDSEQVLAELTDPENQLYADPADRKRLLKILSEKGLVKGEAVRFKRRDNSVFLGEIAARAERDEKGNILYIDGFIKDATAQREAVDALTRAKEEAEAASRLKSDFLSLVSHELRTPVTSIQGFALMVDKLLQNKIGPAVDPANTDAHCALHRAADNLNVIGVEMNRLDQCIDEVFDLFQLESGELSLNLAPVKPTDLAERAWKAALGQAEAKGLTLELDVDGAPPLVLADAEHILQVLRHLLDNAIKFTSDGTITLSVAKQNQAVEFTVKDTGLGIPAESLKIIFNSFTQHGDLLTDKPQGLGLGLAICHCIVTLHSGRIWAESIWGQGSLLGFTLPLADDSE